MHYRLYRPADFPQLYAIELACFQPPIRFSRRYMQRLIANPDSATWIAERSRPADDRLRHRRLGRNTTPKPSPTFKPSKSPRPTASRASPPNSSAASNLPPSLPAPHICAPRRRNQRPRHPPLSSPRLSTPGQGRELLLPRPSRPHLRQTPPVTPANPPEIRFA